MGSIGRMVKLQYTRLEMFALNTSFVDKIEDLTQYVTQYVADDKNKNLNEELLVDEVAGDKDLVKACRSCYNPVPTRPRTPRIILGNLTCDPEDDDIEYFCRTQMIVDEKNSSRGVDHLGSTQMIVDEKNSSKSKKRASDEDYIVSARNLTYDPEGGVEYLCSTQMIVDEKNSSRGVDHLCSTQMIVDEKKPSKPKKRSSDDEDYMVSAEDHGEEESSTKKRPKNVEKKRPFPRKAVQVYNLPTDLPQNLEEYISELNLEVPPLFVAQKLLTPTDVNSNESRLLLPKSLINAEFYDNFLQEDEKEVMMMRKPVEVNLVDDMMREYNTLHLTKWDMNSSSPYVLRRAWNDVVAENKLKRVEVLKDEEAKTIVGMEDDNKLGTDVVARVWSFRRGSDIWFALNIQAMAEVKILGRTKEGRYIIE